MTHERYWSAHKYTGTRPRKKTLRQLARQRAVGLPTFMKCISYMQAKEINAEAFLHPTKGWRTRRLV